MNQKDIEHLAQGFPPSHIGKDHEEVVIELAGHVLSLQQKLNKTSELANAYNEAETAWEKAMMAAIGEDGVGSVSKAIAALKAERDAVLAENALMLKLLTDISEQYQEVKTESEESAAIIDLDYISEVNTYVSRDVDGGNPFSATDALLSTVRADGVEMFAKHCDDSIGFIEPEDEDFYTLMEEQARTFAAQLRAETDTTPSQYESLAGGK